MCNPLNVKADVGDVLTLKGERKRETEVKEEAKPKEIKVGVA